MPYKILSRPVFVLCLVIILTAFILSCGKKGPLSLKSYEKPQPPKQLTALHREGGIILSWRAGGGRDKGIMAEDVPDPKGEIEEFVVLRADGEEGFKNKASTKENKIIDRDFKQGGVYRYKVVAKNQRGILSPDSNVIEVMPATPPPPPDGLAFEIGNDSVAIKWAPSKEAVFFNVYRGFESGAYGMNPVNAEPLKETSYSDSLNPGRDVYYTVRALKGGALRSEGGASVEIAVRPSDFIPKKPMGLKAIRTEGGLVLIWDGNPETWIRGYRVYRSDEGGGFNPTGDSQTPSFIDRDALSRRCAYRVSALGPLKEGSLSGAVECPLIYGG
jgi:predicted small lipoprotein YifL